MLHALSFQLDIIITYLPRIPIYLEIWPIYRTQGCVSYMWVEYHWCLKDNDLYSFYSMHITWQDFEPRIRTRKKSKTSIFFSYILSVFESNCNCLILTWILSNKLTFSCDRLLDSEKPLYDFIFSFSSFSNMIAINKDKPSIYNQQ